MPVGNGGIIGPNNTPSTSSAKGVWSIREAMLAQRAGNWPIVQISDPYFEYTTLLLPGNGTNGAQNNTFLDSSTNNFTITRNGNTTQGTFSPFSQTGWGNYFNGSSYLNTGANAAFAMGTGDFTWECWVNIPAAGAYQAFIDTRTIGAGYNDGYFFGLLTGSLTPVVFKSGSVLSSSVSIQANQWTHLALVRSSGTLTIYVNGTSAGLVADATNLSNNTLGIASLASTLQNPTTGYISNVRITKGGALYTSNFTPSTTPLSTTVSAGTVSLLTCQSNRFLDSSSNAFAITANGSPSVQSFSPFNPTAAWSAATNGGSGYFDGSGDYLTVADNAALEGFDDFTIEFWVYLNSTSDQVILTKGWDAVGTFSPYNINITSGNLVFTASYSGSSWAVLNQVIQSSIGTGRWYHIAVSRSGSTYRLFSNGSLTTTVTSSGTIWSNTTAVTIGVTSAATQPLNGYLCDLRIVKGTAVYTSAFTPPTAPLTAITNTSLLLNFTNAGIYDATSKNDLETVGNAQISTTQSKFGGSSMYFDGTGDYLTSPANPLCRLMGGDFTVEMWVRLAASQSNVGLVSSFTTNNGWIVRLDTTTVVFSYGTGGASTVVSNSASLSTGVWYHIAWTKSGTTLRSFVDGTQVGSNHTVSSAVDTTNTGLQIGRTHTVANDLNGYINDLRITKGIARYTSNFTPPTTAFQLL